jgi:hypothetical protein
MALAGACAAPQTCLLVGGTWMQLGRLRSDVADGEPAPSTCCCSMKPQVPVAPGRPTFLPGPEAHVVLAGDHKQLGPI